MDEDNFPDDLWFEEYEEPIMDDALFFEEDGIYTEVEEEEARTTKKKSDQKAEHEFEDAIDQVLEEAENDRNSKNNQKYKEDQGDKDINPADDDHFVEDDNQFMEDDNQFMEDDNQFMEDNNQFTEDNNQFMEDDEQFEEEVSEEREPDFRYAGKYDDDEKKEKNKKQKNSSTTTSPPVQQQQIPPAQTVPPANQEPPQSPAIGNSLTGNLPIATVPATTTTENLWPPAGVQQPGVPDQPGVPGAQQYGNLDGLGRIGVFTSDGLSQAQRFDSFTIFILLLFVIFNIRIQ